MVFMVPFNICAGGGQATRQPKQCSTVWEPPTHPTATGVWSESKGRCCCPRCRHKLCLQTDVSTAREGKDGNNPSQATHCLNIMNLKPPATSRAVSSSSSHCSTPHDDATSAGFVTALFPADLFSSTATSKPNTASFKAREVMAD